MKVKMLALYYSLIFMSSGAFVSYIGLYYDSINLSNTEVGLLTSAGAVISMLGQPLWGLMSDRARKKNHILMLALLLSSITVWLIPVGGRTLWMIVLFTSMFYFSQTAVSPLSDAMTLELASREKFSFSHIRTAGSFGYAIMAAIAGRIFKADIGYMFMVFSILMLLSFAISFSIPAVEGHQSGKSKVSLFKIFQDKNIVFIYIFVFLIQTTMGFFFAFHSIYTKQSGITTDVIGIGVMIGSFSQFPFMLYFDRIYNKLGIVNILLLSGLASGLRWILYAFALTPLTLYFIWAMHGFTYIVVYLCLAEYMSRNVVKELRTSGQVMNSIILSGISRICGSFLGGIVSTAISLKYTFFISSIICLCTVAVFFILMKKGILFGKTQSCNNVAI